MDPKNDRLKARKFGTNLNLMDTTIINFKDSRYSYNE